MQGLCQNVQLAQRSQLPASQRRLSVRRSANKLVCTASAAAGAGAFAASFFYLLDVGGFFAYGPLQATPPVVVVQHIA